MRIGKFLGITAGFEGKSAENGFYVKKEEKLVQTKNYCLKKESGAKVPKTKQYWLVWLSIFIFDIFFISYAFFTSINPFSDIWLYFYFLFCFSAISALYMTAFIFFIPRKDLREYHACEHKVIVLLTENLPPTLENLKKMPRVEFSCGSVPVGIQAVGPVTIGIGLLICKTSPQVNSAIILLLIPAVCLILSLLLQFFICTREPSEEKLRESLEVAEEFYRQN